MYFSLNVNRRGFYSHKKYMYMYVNPSHIIVSYYILGDLRHLVMA